MSTLKIYQHPIYGDVVLLSDARALESESQKLMACNKRLCSELDELERESTGGGARGTNDFEVDIPFAAVRSYP